MIGVWCDAMRDAMLWSLALECVRQIWQTPGTAVSNRRKTQVRKLIWMPVSTTGFVIVFWGRRKQIRFQLFSSISVSTDKFMRLKLWCRSPAGYATTHKRYFCWFVFPYFLAHASWQSTYTRSCFLRVLLTVLCCCRKSSIFAYLPRDSLREVYESKSWKCCVATLECARLTSNGRKVTWVRTSCLGTILPFDSISGSSKENDNTSLFLRSVINENEKCCPNISTLRFGPRQTVPNRGMVVENTDSWMA
jgi:hypothetical protein